MTLEECLNKAIYDDSYYDEAIRMVSDIPLKLSVDPVWDISDFSEQAVDLYLDNNGSKDIRECILLIINNSKNLITLIPKSDNSVKTLSNNITKRRIKL